MQRGTWPLVDGTRPSYHEVRRLVQSYSSLSRRGRRNPSEWVPAGRPALCGKFHPAPENSSVPRLGPGHSLMTPVLEVGRLVLWRLLLWAAAEDALLEFLDRPTQVRVAAVVLHEADVSSSVQTFKRTSLVQVGLFLRGLEARGKLSLVTAHGGMHSLDLARVRSYPLRLQRATSSWSLEISALRSPEVETSCDKLGYASRSSFAGNGA